MTFSDTKEKPMKENNNNGMIGLKKVWLYLIIIACIGSPFVAFATLRGKTTVNTDNIAINRTSIEKLDIKVDGHDTGIAVLNTKMDIIIGLVEKIEARVNYKARKVEEEYHNPQFEIKPNR
jgi:hypothetical protein